MNHFQFNSLLKNVPSIEVSLEWCHTEGHGTFEKEFEHKSFVVFTNFECFQTGTFDAGDFYTAPSFYPYPLEVCDLVFDVYDQDGDEVKLTKKQEELLAKEIESSITSD